MSAYSKCMVQPRHYFSSNIPTLYSTQRARHSCVGYVLVILRWICSIASVSALYFDRDDRHEASSPSPPFVCPACDKHFNTPRLLKRHLKYAQHPFKFGGKLTMFIRTTIPRWPFCPWMNVQCDSVIFDPACHGVSLAVSAAFWR